MNGKKNGGGAAKTVGIMAVIIFLAKFMGLLRETLVANIYGQGYNSDILNTATQIPLLFFDMTLGVAILSTFVPVFNRFLEQQGKERAEKFASSFLTAVVFAATVFSVLGIIFSNNIVKIMVPGYDQDKIDATAQLLKILFPSIIFTAAAYVAVGLLQSFGEFNIPSLISFVSNFIMIVYLLIFKDKLGLFGVVLSMVVAWAAQLLFQLPALKKKSIKLRFCLDFKEEGLVEAAKLAVPVLISSWVQPLCTVINMSFGSGLGDGAVSGLNWANKIYIIMVGVFAYAVTNFIFPRLSRMSASDGDGFEETARVSLSWIIFIIAYVSAMFISLSNPIIKAVFERGEFTAENTALTAKALYFYSFGMVGYAVCEVLNKSFYALRDGKTPMFTSVMGVCVNFAAAFVFVKLLKMGVGGLALASASSSISIAAALLFMINKKRPGTINKKFWTNFAKTVAAAAVSAAVARLVNVLLGNALQNGTIAVLTKLCICAAPALLVYCFAAILLKCDEAEYLLLFAKEIKSKKSDRRKKTDGE